MVSLFSHHCLCIFCCMSCWSSLPWGWRAFQKDLVGVQSLSLIRTALSVETKTHSFFEGLVISYPNSANPKLLSSCPISMPWSRMGPMALPFNFPYFVHCSLNQLAACSSSRVNIRGCNISAEGLHNFGHQSVLFAILLCLQSGLWEVTVTFWYIQGIRL